MYSKLTKHSRSVTFICFKSNRETLLVSIVDFEQVNVSWVEPCQTSFFAKKNDGQKPLFIIAKSSVLDIWLGAKYVFNKGNTGP